MGQERPLPPLEGRAAESFHHPPTVLDWGWGGIHHCKAQRTDRRDRVEPEQPLPVSPLRYRQLVRRLCVALGARCLGCSLFWGGPRLV